MPAQRIAMRRIREVLRLNEECGLSYGQIARSLGISKGSVANYLSSAATAGLTAEEAAGLDDAALLRCVTKNLRIRNDVIRMPVVAVAIYVVADFIKHGRS